MIDLSFQIDSIRSALEETETMIAIDDEDPYYVIGYLQQALRTAANVLTSLGDRDQSTAGPLHDQGIIKHALLSYGRKKTQHDGLLQKKS